MTKVTFSRTKLDMIVEKHFPKADRKTVAQVATLVANSGETFVTDTNVIAKVAVIGDVRFALLLKPAEFAKGQFAAITFYEDTTGSVLRRIQRRQWKAA